MNSNELRDAFAENGYVVVDGVLDPKQDLQPVMDDYDQLVDNLAERWQAAGLVKSTYRGLPFEQRFTRVVQDAGEAGVKWIDYFDLSLPQTGVTPETPIHLSAAIFDLLRNPRLLDVVEMIIGSEILVNPIHHVRIKPPETIVPEALRHGLNAQTPWHQDQGVALPEADNTDMLTIWVPVVDSTLENGCMRAIPGSHRGELATHCPSSPSSPLLHIPESLLGGAPVALPMKRGSILAFHRLTKHSSLANNSNSIRWSFDLRYQPIGQPTGRPAFPAFVGRSRQHPERILNDWREWAGLWDEARRALIQRENPIFNRWSTDSPMCA